MDTSDQYGWWWLVGYPGRKMPGKLTIYPTGGGKVEITGRLNVASEHAPEWSDHVHIIHGQVEGVPVTLEDCNVFQSPHEYEENNSSIVALFVYIGIHFEHPLDLEFEEVSVRYSYLDEWVDSGDCDIPFTPVTIEFDDGRDNHIEVNINRSLPGGDMQLNEQKCHAHVTVKPLQAMPFYGDGNRLSFAEILYAYLADFLSLATGKQNRPSSMIGIFSLAKRSSSVQMHFPTDKPELPSRIEPFFSFHEVRDNLNSYLSHWSRKHRKLSDVLNLYLRKYHTTFSHPNTEFLNMARALEAYHRRMHGGRYLPEDVYRSKKRPVIDAIQQSFDTNDPNEKNIQDKLLSLTGQANEYSFRRRLDSICYEVLCEYSDFLDDVIGDLDKFIRTVVANRNQLTHVLEEPSSESIEPDRWDKYYGYVSNMRRLLRICLLVEMEFPRDAIEQIMKREGHWVNIR